MCGMKETDLSGMPENNQGNIHSDREVMKDLLN